MLPIQNSQTLSCSEQKKLRRFRLFLITSVVASHRSATYNQLKKKREKCFPRILLRASSKLCENGLFQIPTPRISVPISCRLSSSSICIPYKRSIYPSLPYEGSLLVMLAVGNAGQFSQLRTYCLKKLFLQRQRNGKIKQNLDATICSLCNYVNKELHKFIVLKFCNKIIISFLKYPQFTTVSYNCK